MVGHCSLECDGVGSVKTDTCHTKRPLEIRSDREPILMGPLARVRYNLQDDPDTSMRTPSRGKTAHSLAQQASA